MQWGLPVGQHEAVAKKIAFIAATTYGLESMLTLSCLLADDDRNDIRIEAALVKLYGSEMAWLMADELIQIRGGRGYETADSLAARGEKAIAVEQLLRDLRINRIFEGSSEIMHLLIAREAVDQHLSVAGDIIDPDASMGRKVKAGLRGGAFYGRWLPTLTVGKGQIAGGYARYGALAKHVRFVERASRRMARETFYGMARWRGKMERKQAFLGRMVDIGAELFAMSATVVRATIGGPAGVAGARRSVLLPGSRPGRGALRPALGQHRRRRRQARRAGARRPLRIPRRRRAGATGRRGVGGHLGARAEHGAGPPPPDPQALGVSSVIGVTSTHDQRKVNVC